MSGTGGAGVRLDHLVVAAPDLPSGRAWLERRLGMPMEPGGEHPTFGTHNALLGLSSAGFGRGYLEVIAVNPAAPAPPRPRWFGLDTLKLWDGPRLVHWVLAVPGLEGALRASPEEHGEGLPLARGERRWRLSVPPDGSLPLGGVPPSLIEWEGPSPANTLPASGVTLLELRLRTPEPQRLRGALAALGAASLPLSVEAGENRLEAVLDTPGGRVSL
ncbi:MAG: VOC family protein [Deinococcus sp.]